MKTKNCRKTEFLWQNMHNWNCSLPLNDGLPACLPAKSIQQQRKKQDISRRRDRSVSSNFVETKNSCQWSISKEFFQIISIIINPTFFFGLFSTADRTIEWQLFNSHKKIKIKECVSQGIYYSYSYSYYFIQETKKIPKISTCACSRFCFPSFSFLCNKFYCIQTVV